MFLISTMLPIGVVVFGGIGVVQLAYIVPLYMHLKKNGQINTAKGLIIAASITVLLNVGCWTQFRVGG
jgi:hypothetical protein